MLLHLLFGAATCGLHWVNEGCSVTSSDQTVDVSRYSDYIEERRSASQVPVGRALEQARRRVGYSTATAAESLHISERELANFESGLRTAPPSLITDMAALYGVKSEMFGSRLLVPRLEPHIDPEEQTLWLGWTPIALETGTAKNRHLIRSIASALRSMRNLGETEPLYLREKELPMIGSLLDLDDEDLPTLIMHWFRLTLNEVNDVLEKMHGDENDAASLPSVNVAEGAGGEQAPPRTVVRTVARTPSETGGHGETPSLSTSLWGNRERVDIAPEASSGPPALDISVANTAKNSRGRAAAGSAFWPSESDTDIAPAAEVRLDLRQTSVAEDSSTVANAPDQGPVDEADHQSETSTKPSIHLDVRDKVQRVAKQRPRIDLTTNLRSEIGNRIKRPLR